MEFRSRQAVMRGELVLTNTIEDFKKLDKNELLKNLADKVDSLYHLYCLMIQVQAAMDDDSAAQDPLALSPFLIVMYADLKKYKFFYWFGFPAFASKSPYTLQSCTPARDAFKDKVGLLFIDESLSGIV